MSDRTSAQPEHGAAPDPEAAPRRGRAGRRGALTVVAALLAVVLLAGGAFATLQFFLGGGLRPAEVLPASTFALATVDLDPAGGQKVAAIKTLRTFPSWRKRTGVTADSDLMRSVYDLLLGSGRCKALDYDEDVRPWVGSRAGVGGVLLEGDKPAPVLALQVKDEDKARTGFAKVARCAGADDFGWTLSGDYVIASDSNAHARAIATAGEGAKLAADSDFQRWTDEAGGAGVMNFYLAPGAPAVISEAFESRFEGLLGGGPGLPPGLGGPGGGFPTELPSGFPTELPSGFPTRFPTKIPTIAPQDDALQGGPGPGSSVGSDAVEPVEPDGTDGADGALEDFPGAAATLRFADGGLELSVASGAKASEEDPGTIADQVKDLPEDTGAVIALAVPPSALDGLAEGRDDPGQALLGGLTGLDLPGDLKTLLGQAFSVSLSGESPTDLEKISGPGDLPLGAVLRGDAAEIEAVIDKLDRNAAFGGRLFTRVSAEEDAEPGAEQKVAVATTREYADQLLAEGSLEDDEGFRESVRHLDDAQALMYLDLDGDWGERFTEKLSQSDDKGTQELAGDLAVLRGLGASSWTDGDVSRAVVRLSVR